MTYYVKWQEEGVGDYGEPIITERRLEFDTLEHAFVFASHRRATEPFYYGIWILREDETRLGEINHLGNFVFDPSFIKESTR